MKSQEQTCLLYTYTQLASTDPYTVDPRLSKPLWSADSSGVVDNQTVWINEMIKVMVIDNFPVVLIIAIELLKQKKTLLYTKTQQVQVHVAAG